MFASDFRMIARRKLQGKWLTSVIVTLVAVLLGGVDVGSSANTGNRNGNALFSFSPSSGFSFHVGELDFGFSPDTWPDTAALWEAAAGFFTAFLIVYVLVALIVGGAVELGLCNYNINLIAGHEQRPFDTLFGRFSILGKAMLLRLATGFLVFLWSLLLIVPGIIAAYRYSMASYVMAQNPDVGVMEAIECSKDLMDGNKFRLFCLEISFIGWVLLSVLTLGIGFIFLRPYMQAAHAAFYLEIAAKGNNM